MGREIRMVPKDWEHPRNEQGHYKVLYDKTYEEAAQEWLQGLNDWESDKGGERTRVMEEYGTRYYWDWDNNPPNKEYYREPFESEPCCFQIYETVSEGSPISPVFETKKDMFNWLVEEGYSENAATQFIDNEWAPSMMICNREIKMNIHSYDCEK